MKKHLHGFKRAQSIDKLEERCEQFEKDHPLGTRVLCYKLLNPLREPEETEIVSTPWVMGGHSVMVKVKGVSGGVTIDSIEKIAEPEDLKVAHMGTMALLPPPAKACQECSREHHPSLPHDRDSLYYNTLFEMRNDRPPTWKDAMEHCTEDVKQQWIAMYADRGVTITLE